MGTRIVAAFRRAFSERLNDKESIERLKEELAARTLDLTVVIGDSRLEIEDQDAMEIFVIQKILSYLSRLNRE